MLAQPRRVGIITLILAGCQLNRGLLEVAIDLGQMAIEFAQDLGDRSAELEARLSTARANTAHGELEAAVLLLESVIEGADGPDLMNTQARDM